MSGARVSPRLPVKLPVSISIAGEPEPAEAVLLDISTRGIGLRTFRPLAPGSQIDVTWAGGILSGTVRHCKKQWKGYVSPIEHYRVGIQLRKPLDDSALDDIASGGWRNARRVPAHCAL